MEKMHNFQIPKSIETQKGFQIPKSIETQKGFQIPKTIETQKGFQTLLNIKNLQIAEFFRTLILIRNDPNSIEYKWKQSSSINIEENASTYLEDQTELNREGGIRQSP